MPVESTHITPASQLNQIITETDRLSVNSDGELMIEGRSVPSLLRQFGSPLYIVSEETLRQNYRRILRAFTELWPSPVKVLYAIKANNNLAIRAILHQEGAGGDCFGESELYATFMGGADPDAVVLNGSNKSLAEIRRAAELGVRINIDGTDEIDYVADIAQQLNRTIRVNLRLKVLPKELDRIGNDYFDVGSSVSDFIRDEKWGFSVAAAVPLIKHLQGLENVTFEGYHLHLGRFSRDPSFFAIGAGALAEAIVELHDLTGFAPRLIDIGGGWARERDPEGRTLTLNRHTIEEYAAATCSALLKHLHGKELPIPDLWLEPGRYIVGNAVALLATVGEIKRDLGKTWIHVDASTNNLMRADTHNSAYHVIAASGMDRPATERAIVAGPTCINSFLGIDVLVPKMKRGDAMAVLDAGMYAETGSTQFNGVPRPATALVSDDHAEIIKERETVQDILAKHRIPERLRAYGLRRNMPN